MANSMDVVCVRCGRLMKVAKISVTAVELIDENGKRYRSFSYDKKKCPNGECGYEVLVRHGAPNYNKDEMPQFPDVTYW